MPENEKVNDFLESLDEDAEKEEKENDDEKKANESEGNKRFIVCHRCGRKVKNKPITLKHHEKYCKKKYAKMEKEKAKATHKENEKSNETVIVKPPIPQKQELPKKETKPARSVSSPEQKLPEKAKTKKEPLKIAGFELDLPIMIIIGGLMAAGLFIIKMIAPAPAEKPRQATKEAQGAQPKAQPVVEASPAPPEPPKPIYSIKL